jgi:mRNA interferase HigB
MRVIKPSTLKEYYTKHADAEGWLKAWFMVATKSQWQNLQDIRETYKKTDAIKAESGSIVTIFNVKGNNYRLIVAIHFNTQRIYVRDFMTHEEYNSQRWKKRH